MKWLKTLLTLAFTIVLLSTLMALRVTPGSDTEETSADTLAADRRKHVQALQAMIKGKESKPADSVYKNIHLLKGMPAGRMLAVMEMGFSKSLGVSCGHCHNTNDWSSDEKTPKLVAREMWRMMGRINGELLKGITQLKAPVVNCTTCHRGQLKPALNLE